MSTRKAPRFFGNALAWSPDGSMLAISAGDSFGSQTVAFAPASGGRSERIAAQNWRYVGSLAWLAGGSGLVMDAIDSFQRQLWFLPYPSGAAQRITRDVNTYAGVDLTANGRALVTVELRQLCRLWIAPQGQAKRAREFASHRSKMEGSGGIAWTPDGKLVCSSFTGIGADLWIGNTDGSARQLTESSPLNITPAVSPDGRTIVFASALSTGPGETNLWRMDRDGGNLKQLTQGGFDYLPQISPDGKWIVYQPVSMPLGRSTLRKVPIDGGASVELAGSYASAPGISPDGRWIAFQTHDARTHKAIIGVIPFEAASPRVRSRRRPMWADLAILDRVCRGRTIGAGSIASERSTASAIYGYCRLRADQPNRLLTSATSEYMYTPGHAAARNSRLHGGPRE